MKRDELPTTCPLLTHRRLIITYMMVELIVGIIIQNVELLSKMEDMKVKETHIQVPAGCFTRALHLLRVGPSRGMTVAWSKGAASLLFLRTRPGRQPVAVLNLRVFSSYRAGLCRLLGGAGPGRHGLHRPPQPHDAASFGGPSHGSQGPERARCKDGPGDSSGNRHPNQVGVPRCASYPGLPHTHTTMVQSSAPTIQNILAALLWLS